MHVLIIPSWYPNTNNSVAGIFFKEQAEALSRMGLKIGVIAAIKKSPRLLFRRSNLTKTPIVHLVPTLTHEYYCLPRLPMVNKQIDLTFGHLLFARYKSEYGTPDILHAHSAVNGGVLARKLSKDYGIPFLITEHSSAYRRKLLSKFEINESQKAFAAAKSLVAVSDSLANDLESVLPSTRGKWNKIPNAVNQIFFANPISKKSAADHKNHGFDFLTIAELSKNKGVDILIKAFEKIESKIEVRLMIGGQGEDLQRLKTLANASKAYGRIKFLGRLSRDQTLSALSHSDAFVLPSLNETFGLVLAEALAQGKPIISTNCGGPESIVTRENGILVPVNNVGSLQLAMLKIIENYEAYNSETIRKACFDRFSSKVVCSQILEIYSRQILAN